MNKINDLYSDLDNEVDLSNLSNNNIKVSKLWKWFFTDIFGFWKKDINLVNKKVIKISKNKTKKFDSLFISKKKAHVDIITPKKDLNFFIKSIFTFFRKKKKIYELTSPKRKRKFNKWILFLVFLVFVFYWNKIIIENLVTNWYQNILSLKNDFWDLSKAKNDVLKSNISFNIANILLKPFLFIPNNNIKM